MDPPSTLNPRAAALAVHVRVQSRALHRLNERRQAEHTTAAAAAARGLSTEEEEEEEEEEDCFIDMPLVVVCIRVRRWQPKQTKQTVLLPSSSSFAQLFTDARERDAARAWRKVKRKEGRVTEV